MKHILTVSIFIIFFSNFVFAKGDKKRAEQIKKDIEYLASDALEGRLTGSAGEITAAHYLEKRFKEIGLAPFWDNQYLQTYQIANGKKLGDETVLKIFEDTLTNTQYASMPFSANGEMSELVLPKTNEQGGFWLVPISKVSKKLLNNPHDNALQEFENKTLELINNGAKGVVFYNDIDAEHDYIFNAKTKTDTTLKQIVLFINNDAYKKYILPKMKADWIDFYAVVDVQDNIREGRNVAATINNGSDKTVFIGAHFDHLGYGQDHNSLYTGTTPQIHNGADDNASGVAAMLALAEMLKQPKYKNNNYVFVSFSGEELGLLGSKKFLDMNSSIINNANYMINIDMLGRFDETKNSITIGGVGTSPDFIPTIQKSKPFFTPKYDSAGVGPSDHTSFYLKNIPVLFFFTGLHSDYHKPTDDADKINFVGEEKLVQYIYSLIGALNKKDKLDFTKTKEPKMEGKAFKVTLGIMPDYTFEGNGVRADGIIDGKVAQKIGMQAGDIITQLGDIKVLEMQSYMEALSKFKKGDATKVKIKRGAEEKLLDVIFE